MSETNLLLSKLTSCPQSSEEIHKYFSEVAELLMNNYLISKRDINYEIVEIEFYLFSPNHQDIITYPRNSKAGEWFFHQSGVDLTFESKDNQFGGILIRGIKRITRREEGDNRPLLILGPQKCVDELWDAFNAFSGNAFDYPLIVSGDVPKDDNIKNYPRWIPLNKKTIDKANKDIKKAKNLKTEDTITKNRSYLNVNPYLGLKGIYDNIDTGIASDIMFNRQYRFLKEASIEKESSDWKKYTSKPKMI